MRWRGIDVTNLITGIGGVLAGAAAVGIFAFSAGQMKGELLALERMVAMERVESAAARERLITCRERRPR